MLLGLFSWLLAGLIAGILSLRMLPGRPPLRLLPTLTIAVAGALVGGLVATWLGFGGLTGFDWRGFVCAALSSLVSLLAYRSVNLAA